MKELIEIQSRLKAPKNQYNSFGKYKYRSCEDILEGVKPLLTANNCTLTIVDKIINVGNFNYIEAHVCLMNSEGKTINAVGVAREAETQKGMNPAQITGSTSSYARKYALNGLFCIDDTKDDDTKAPPKDERVNQGDLIKKAKLVYSQIQNPDDKLKQFIDQIDQYDNITIVGAMQKMNKIIQEQGAK